MEELQFDSNPVSLIQWVNLLVPVVVTATEVQPALKNWDYLLVPSRYIGYPNVIDHWPLPGLYAENGMLHQASCRQSEKPSVIAHCLPLFHSTTCRSSSSSQHSDQLEPRSSWGGGDPVEALQFHSNTQSHCSSGSTLCTCPRDAPTLATEPVSLLALSRYNIYIYINIHISAAVSNGKRKPRRFPNPLTVLLVMQTEVRLLTKK